MKININKLRFSEKWRRLSLKLPYDMVNTQKRIVGWVLNVQMYFITNKMIGRVRDPQLSLVTSSTVRARKYVVPPTLVDFRPVPVQTTESVDS